MDEKKEVEQQAMQYAAENEDLIMLLHQRVAHYERTLSGDKLLFLAATLGQALNHNMSLKVVVAMQDRSKLN